MILSTMINVNDWVRITYPLHGTGQPTTTFGRVERIWITKMGEDAILCNTFNGYRTFLLNKVIELVKIP